MKKERRAFIKASTAIGVLGITGIGAAAASQKKIGFVVSTRDHAEHIACFLQALEDNSYGMDTNKVQFFWESAEGKYGRNHKQLYNRATKHVNRNVDLIVAAGGLTSAIAVAQAIQDAGSSTKFVYLIGRTPTAGDANYTNETSIFVNSNAKSGGVDQSLVDQNENNWKQLNSIDNSVTASNVGLLVNLNNPMTAPEVAKWNTGNGHDSDLVFTIAAENDQQISLLFSNINLMQAKKTIAGIVVSSDPYFRSLASEFDTELRDPNGGNFQGYVCYPYQEYLNSTASNKSHKSKNTPLLAIDSNGAISKDAAYYKLGLKVVDFLNSTSPTVATWDGNNWKNA
jgi:hypothetical protein